MPWTQLKLIAVLLKSTVSSYFPGVQSQSMCCVLTWRSVLQKTVVQQRQGLALLKALHLRCLALLGTCSQTYKAFKKRTGHLSVKVCYFLHPCPSHLNFGCLLNPVMHVLDCSTVAAKKGQKHALILVCSLIVSGLSCCLCATKASSALHMCNPGQSMFVNECVSAQTASPKTVTHIKAITRL